VTIAVFRISPTAIGIGVVPTDSRLIPRITAGATLLRRRSVHETPAPGFLSSEVVSGSATAKQGAPFPSALVV
jgi:hypothetical protein